MAEFETYRGMVYPWHCDVNNHMNVQYYMAKMDEATWHFMSFLGVTSGYLRENKRGMVAAEQHIKYYEELVPGNLIHIKTQLIAFKPKVITMFHIMINSESNITVADAKMVGIHINTETRKSVPFPEELQTRINVLL